jgi:RHS repeat-associated protein
VLERSVLDWGSQNVLTFGERRSRFTNTNLRFFGSLLSRQVDNSHLQYLRNRYYDPITGRFTQEDPIGIAGGLNLYGFAGGDPVNFGDPFGLCPEGMSVEECISGTRSDLKEAIATSPSQQFIDAVAGRLAPAKPLLEGVAFVMLSVLPMNFSAGAVARVTPTTRALYRAVTSEELATIVNSGGRFVADAGGGKYFATTAEGAAQYARMASRAFGDGPYTIVRTTIERGLLRALPDATVVVDRGIGTVRLPGSALPRLGPAEILLAAPLPR